MRGLFRKISSRLSCDPASVEARRARRDAANKAADQTHVRKREEMAEIRERMRARPSIRESFKAGYRETSRGPQGKPDDEQK